MYSCFKITHASRVQHRGDDVTYAIGIDYHDALDSFTEEESSEMAGAPEVKMIEKIGPAVDLSYTFQYKDGVVSNDQLIQVVDINEDS